jgi:hypothetical protein
MTNNFRMFPAAAAGVLLCSCICFGEPDETVQLHLTPSGFASMELGEIVKGGFNKKTNANMDQVWMNQMTAGLSVDAAFDARNSLDIGMEMKMYNDFPVSLKLQPQYRYQYFYPYLSRAEFTHFFGHSTENPLVTLSAGYFPFKYNKDVRNLGEYLFRSGAYPQFILNSIDFPLARLMGIHATFSGESIYSGSDKDATIGQSLLRNLKVDGILYSNLQWYALGDWNAAIIMSEKLAGCVELGLGATFNSILSVDSTLTTPHDPATLYHITYNETTGKGDSSFYTFRGAKLMARASIDLKKLLSSDLFGKEDLRIYGEAAILGLKDYPQNFRGGIRYDSIKNRVPVMGGINLPACNVLDVLSIEVEYFDNPYPNDIGAITQQGLPIPGPVTENGGADFRSMGIYKNDKYKWSIYASKTIAGYYTIMAQVASDHLRPRAVNDQNVDFEETLHATNQWYYMLKLTAGF